MENISTFWSTPSKFFLCWLLLPLLLCPRCVKGVYENDVHYEGPVNIREGDNFTIRCTISSYSFGKWTKDGVPITSLPGLEFKTSESDELAAHHKRILLLSVEQASEKHEGSYYCNPFSRKHHRLHVYMKERKAGRQGDTPCTDLKAGKTLSIRCNVKNPGNNPTTWMKDSVKIYPSDRISATNTELIIQDAQVNDAGTYMCLNRPLSANLPAGSFGSIIKVYTPIKIKSSEESKTAKINSSVVLSCEVETRPAPKILWVVGNEDLIAKDRFSIDSRSDNANNVHRSLLTIKDVKTSDANFYTCVVSHSRCLREEYSLRLYAFPNAILTNEEFPGKGIILDTRMRKLVLQCNYTEDVNAKIMWYKDGKELPTSENSEKYEIKDDEKTLTIKDPMVKDAGYYTCVVHGNSNINVTIYVRTNVAIDVEETSKNLVEGDTLSLPCKASGYPTPAVYWLKDNEQLNSTDERISYESWENASNAVLKIQNLNFDDRADYTCVAYNNYSNATMTVLVRVKDKLAALWPFLGICVEVAVLCAIIFIYEKKRVKPDFEESDTDQNPENKNLADQKEPGQEVRQRK